jgi:hypothetical protein
MYISPPPLAPPACYGSVCIHVREVAQEYFRFKSGFPGPFGGSGKCFVHMKTQHMAAPAPAAPMRGGRWGRHALCFHMYEAPPGTLGRPRKARFKTEELLSDLAYTAVVHRGGGAEGGGAATTVQHPFFLPARRGAGDANVLPSMAREVPHRVQKGSSLPRQRCKLGTKPYTAKTWRQNLGGKQQVENFAFRAAGNGTGIQNLRIEGSRNQESLLILVHQNAVSHARVGGHFRKSFRCRLERALRWFGVPP